MIYALAKSVKDKLKARSCPVPVVLDAPERSKPTGYYPERIVFDYDTGDSFGGALSQHRNPRHYLVRKVPAKATIYARSPKAGAFSFEHRERAEALLDMVLAAIHEYAAEQKFPWNPKSGGFFVPADLEGSDTIGAGAAYELKFEITRSVQAVNWAGEGAPEATVGGVDGVGITNTVRASLDGDDFEQVIP